MMFGGIFGKLFGSEKVIDAGINGIDKMFFTGEEKSDAKLKFLKAYEPFKLAQRLLALIFAFDFSVAFLAAIVFACSGLDWRPIVNVVVAFNLGTIVLAIVVFYFGGGTLESLKKGGGK